MLIAHISDLHLGRKSALHGAERLISFRQALATLAAAKPDAIVIAGDTFDGPHIDQAVIEEAAKSMSAPKNSLGEAIPVICIPGNHDPADADKLWTIFQNALEPDSAVRLALTPEVFELAEGKLVVEAYPCPTQFSAEAPWEKRLPVSSKPDSLRVVVAHGTMKGGPVPEGEMDAYPFTQADLQALGADYVALGHFHGLYLPWPDGDECERYFCYCGTHEPDQYGSDAGYALLAKVAKGRPARLRRVKVGKRHWCLINLSGPADLPKVDDLLKQVQANPDPARFVIRLKVESKTSWAAKECTQLDHLEETLRALGAQVERRGTARARLDVQTLDVNGLPSGAIKEALLSLKAELDLTADGNRRELLAAAIQVGWEKIQQAESL